MRKMIIDFLSMDLFQSYLLKDLPLCFIILNGLVLLTGRERESCSLGSPKMMKKIRKCGRSLTNNRNNCETHA